MTLTDVLIIYLAAGSPFAVYRFLNKRRRRAHAEFWDTTAVWLFWPILGATGVIRAKLRRLNALSSANASDARKNETAAWNKVRQLFHGYPVEIDLEARGVIERYIGLSQAVAGTVRADEPEVFRVVGREDGAIGAACLKRRNLARLLRHHKDARVQFLALAGCFDGSPLANELKDLAAMAGDSETAIFIANHPGSDVKQGAAGNIWLPKREYLEM